MKSALKSTSRQKTSSKSINIATSTPLPSPPPPPPPPPSQCMLVEPRNVTNKSSSKDIVVSQHSSSGSSASLRVHVPVTTRSDDGSSAGRQLDQWNVEKARKWDPWEDGTFKRPHVQEPNETNFLGGLGPNVGHGRNKVCIQRPTEVQKIYNMRTRNQPVFTFCENPRLANNVVGKKLQVDHTNVKLIAKKVERMRLAQNVPTPPPSDFSEDPTEIFDNENPLDMDYQGLDHKETYQRDEQEFQNRREYSRQKRYIDKKATATETFSQLKEATRQRRYGLPDFYDPAAGTDGATDDDEKVVVDWKDKYRVNTGTGPEFKRPVPAAIPFVPPPTILATLTRTGDKAENVDRRQMDDNRRRQQLAEMQEKTNLRSLQREEEAKQQKRLADETLVVRLAEDDFDQYFANDYAEIQRHFDQLPPVYQKQCYPHTLRETKHLRHQMNRSKRRIRDEAKVRQQVTGALQQCREVANADLEANDVSSSDGAKSLSEQSTDDEDALSIGQKGDRTYQLRGFHYLMGDELRGRDDVKPKSRTAKPPRRCATRKEWFDTLAPSNVGYSFFKNNLSSVPSKAAPTDADFVIFAKEQFLPRSIEIGPIKDMLVNVPAETKIIDAKIPKIKKPKRLRVKRFNMTGYIFGAPDRQKPSAEIKVAPDKRNKYGVTKEKIDKIDGAYARYLNRTKAMRHNRMRTLGIPIADRDVTDDGYEGTVVSSCGSSGSDWIPDQAESALTNDAKANFSKLTIGSGRVSKVMRRPNYSVTNMRAPQRREPTLRKHPRRMRVPSDQHLLDPNVSDETVVTKYHHHNTAVSSKIFVEKSTRPDSASDDSRGAYAVPRLCRLADDVVHAPNLDMVRTDFTDAFDARHHHDHHDNTQHKVVYVKFQPKLPKFKIPPKKKTKAQRALPFQAARPLQRDQLNADFSVPTVAGVTPGAEDGQTRAIRKQTQRVHRTLPADMAFHSRRETVYSCDKMKFHNAIRACNKRCGGTSNDNDDHRWFIDKAKFVNELREELASIKSCNSSRSTSVCSNNTNDSGSYLRLEGTKVPCDFIAKPQVPFDEIERCRVRAGPLVQHDEYYGPYYHVPFAGQQQDMRQLSLPKDKFFTSGVRNRYGIRNRLQVDVPGFAADHIGKRHKKFISQLATEWDDYYQNEIKNRPRVRKFKPRTIMSQAREALRNRFHSNYIREAITENALLRQKELQYATEVERFRDLCEPLFAAWEETSYRSYIQKMQDVKPYFLKTDQLKSELQRLQGLYTKVDMAIIYAEADWRRCTVLQNFHYLLAEQPWRAQNDWMHRRPDGTVENYRESIERRATCNMRRLGGKDSGWAVKRFYEQFFAEHPEAKRVHCVFADSESLRNGVLQVKSKSFMCLQELHFSMWTLSNVEHAYEMFRSWSDAFLAKRQKFVKGRCSKKYFVENLAGQLEAKALVTLDGCLRQAISDKMLRTVMALCDTLYVATVPQNIRDNMKNDADMVDKFTVLVNIAMQLLEKLDQIPRRLRLRAERKCRADHAFRSRQAKRACATEERIQRTAEQMKKNLAPPPRPQRPPGKLARSVLPKVGRQTVAPHTVVSEVDKLFYRAFTDDDVPVPLYQSAEDVSLLRSLQSNCIPFYFDHFLRLHDYFPCYDFQTQIELREGDERALFGYDDVLDDVYRFLGEWQRKRSEQIERHIRNTWHLYNMASDTQL